MSDGYLIHERIYLFKSSVLVSYQSPSSFTTIESHSNIIDESELIKLLFYINNYQYLLGLWKKVKLFL